MDLPCDVHTEFGLIMGPPRSAARLACASREFRSRLVDRDGLLRVSLLETSSLPSALEGVRRVSFRCLRGVRLDLCGRAACLFRRDVEQLVVALGARLGDARVLESLAIRLTSFDTSYERMRLGHGAWGALVAGLGSLAPHGRLRSLELSFIPIKLSQATQVMGAAAAGPLTLLGALGRLGSLEELALTHDDIFGDTALELASALGGLPRLRRMNVSRNRISKQVMLEMRATIPKDVKVEGSELQTSIGIGARSGTRRVFQL